MYPVTAMATKQYAAFCKINEGICRAISGSSFARPVKVEKALVTFSNADKLLKSAYPTIRTVKIPADCPDIKSMNNVMPLVFTGVSAMSHALRFIMAGLIPEPGDCGALA
eukprot:GHVO01016897.1.p2 GENE.GHVO01016897.1~~GHVO01016897.1.p2  ORF type:complete len:110 (-),score=7.53 GHVO01016897.1:11-340(-)